MLWLSEAFLTTAKAKLSLSPELGILRPRTKCGLGTSKHDAPRTDHSMEVHFELQDKRRLTLNSDPECRSCF